MESFGKRERERRRDQKKRDKLAQRRERAAHKRVDGPPAGPGPLLDLQIKPELTIRPAPPAPQGAQS